MEIVTKKLSVPENSIKFGIFCHLYLDYHFIESFLIPEFIWDNENNKVINPRNNKEWTRNEFFSNSGMYGSYTEINTLMIKNGHIPLDTISKIPNTLPNSGIEIFDSRREKTWRDELNEYLSENREYTGDVFNYERLWNFITEISNKGAMVVASNSDPKNSDINDDFFDNLYSKFEIERVSASRMINSNAKKRGVINELLISNIASVF